MHMHGRTHARTHARTHTPHTRTHSWMRARTHGAPTDRPNVSQALPRSPAQQAESGTESPNGEEEEEEEEGSEEQTGRVERGMPVTSTSVDRTWGATGAPPARGALLNTVRDEY